MIHRGWSVLWVTSFLSWRVGGRSELSGQRSYRPASGGRASCAGWGSPEWCAASKIFTTTSDDAAQKPEDMVERGFTAHGGREI